MELARLLPWPPRRGTTSSKCRRHSPRVSDRRDPELRRAGDRCLAGRPVSPSGFEFADDDVDLAVGQHSARALRKRRHRGPGNSVGGYTANDRIVSDGEINRIAQADCGAARSIRTMASGTVSRIEETEVHNSVRSDDLCIRWIASATSGSHRQGCCKYNGYAIHRLSSFIPEASMPERMASGRRCQVRMRSCCETMMPATIPNATCEATNQSQ